MLTANESGVRHPAKPRVSSAKSRPELVVPGTVPKDRVMGQPWTATVTKDSPYDPRNEVIRKDG